LPKPTAHQGQATSDTKSILMVGFIIFYSVSG